MKIIQLYIQLNFITSVSNISVKNVPKPVTGAIRQLNYENFGNIEAARGEAASFFCTC